MIITNRHDLPEALVSVLSRDRPPTSGGFSVSTLISPPRIALLTKRHWDEIEVDVSERLWLLLGTATHYVIEKAKIPDSLVEEKLFTVLDGEQIRARPDLWKDETLYDWKVTSVWTAIFNPRGKPEWEAQLNIYAWLYSLQGFITKKLVVPAILRDWQKGKAKQGGDYPPIPMRVFNIPLWTPEDTIIYVRERMRLHKEAMPLPDDQLPLCTDEERWLKGNKYALMKEGRKSAVRVYDTKEEAMKELASCDSKHYVEERKGEAVRCKDYCDVAPFCNHCKAATEERYERNFI